MIVRDFSRLPDRVRATILAGGYTSASFVLAMKTTFKPTATIPIIWIVVMHNALLLCNTHKTRGMWREFKAGAGGDEWIGLRRTSLGDPYIEMAGGEQDEDRTYITLNRNIGQGQLAEVMSEIERLLTSAGRTS